MMLSFKLQFDPLVGGRPSIMVSIELIHTLLTTFIIIVMARVDQVWHLIRQQWGVLKMWRRKQTLEISLQ